ncbi:hypothetical protein SIO70_26515 [Chitinophaga sancti]|uniref:hypothetical protein n=1 Tax=Chitinophaga sancti TaxID=1004 RepID=UPI002A748FFE|nr:hypothetical protein [Chitinophaga sancti]WPQ61920.1 hypothetical protein SIO70_26515 [Chitinophaga sancti]
MAKNQSTKTVTGSNNDKAQPNVQGKETSSLETNIDQTKDQKEKITVEIPSKEPVVPPASITEETKDSPEETFEELQKKIKYFEGKAKLLKQREAVQDIIGKLNAFTFKQTEEEENFETSDRYYRGCVITIKDDKGDTFAISNPYLITKVVEALNMECETKIVEINTKIRA